MAGLSKNQPIRHCPQPSSLPALGISAFCPEHAGKLRHSEPESEAETPGIGAFGTAKEELSLPASGRFGMGQRCGSGEPEGALLGTPLYRQVDLPNEPVRGQLGR